MAPRARPSGRVGGGRPLLLDEMLSGVIAEQLRARGHDVVAVVDDTALTGLPDDQVLEAATAAGRALVTANIKDFVPLDRRRRAAGHPHGGLLLVSSKSIPSGRTFIGAVVAALDQLLLAEGITDGAVVFLQAARTR
jgi:hypothetical protein